MERTRALVTGPLAGWTGRLLLLGAVVFWWGAVVVPNLISLAFPAWLPPESIPRDLNPDIDWEGRLANRVSATALLVLAVLAFSSAEASRRRSAGWVVIGGWTALAATAILLAWEEMSDFHATALPGFGRQLFGEDLATEAGSFIWVLIASPLVVAFTLTMGVFYARGLRTSDVRTPFVLGIAAWLLVLLCEGLNPVLIRGRATALMEVLEETLEFGGTLLLALSAAFFCTRHTTFAGALRGRRLHASVIGSAIGFVGLGCLFVALVFRAPLVDARATGSHEVYWVSLADQQSVAQEFPMPAAPLSRVSLRLVNRDLDRRPGTAIWRLTEAGEWNPRRLLREGRVSVPAGDIPVWIDVDFPLVTAEEGRRLLLQVVAENEPRAALRIGMVKGDRYTNGRLWVNGELTWPDQDLEFVAHGASEPTRSKFQSLWHIMTSDWHWPAQIAKAAVALMFVTLIPVLLIVAIWSRPRTGGIPSGLR